jgi:5-oxoprolinase (ATP-hydrolysing)
MMSDGGLCPGIYCLFVSYISVEYFNGFRAILSGPAGGVVGYAMTTYNPSTKYYLK